MSSTQRDARLIELVAAFTEMGPAWVRWVQATIPDDTVSYARLRVLNALTCQQEGLTMTKLAQALEVTGHHKDGHNHRPVSSDEAANRRTLHRATALRHESRVGSGRLSPDKPD